MIAIISAEKRIFLVELKSNPKTHCFLANFKKEQTFFNRMKKKLQFSIYLLLFSESKNNGNNSKSIE